MSKLVRDLIPEVIPENKRAMYRFSTLDKEEYRKHLNQKLLEEANEYIEEENIEELADLLEVVDALKKLNGFDSEEIERVKTEKKAKRGGFEKGIFLEVVS